jgi:hypothetical protein
VTLTSLTDSCRRTDVLSHFLPEMRELPFDLLGDSSLLVVFPHRIFQMLAMIDVVRLGRDSCFKDHQAFPLARPLLERAFPAF